MAKLHAASAPLASCSISDQCSRTRRVAAFDAWLNSSPIKPRTKLATGSADQAPRFPRYHATLPAKMIMAASRFAFFDADNRNSRTTLSALRSSSTIRLATRGYFSTRAATAAPDLKKRSIPNGYARKKWAARQTTHHLASIGSSFEFSQPRRHMREKVRFVAMRARHRAAKKKPRRWGAPGPL